MKKKDFIYCVDKEWGNRQYYSSTAYSLIFETYITTENKMKLRCAKVYDGQHIHTFNTITELHEWYTELVKSYTKETVIFYTDDLGLANLFLSKDIEKRFADKASYIYMYEDSAVKAKIELRTLDGFLDNIDDARAELHITDDEDVVVIQKYSQNLFDNIFIPERYFYISRFQYIRRKIKLAYKHQEDANMKNLKMKWNTYVMLGYAKRGGICFNHYPYARIDDELMHVDRTSAYIFDMLIEKYPCEAFKHATMDYTNYDTAVYSFFGRFSIVYESTENIYFTTLYSDMRHTSLPIGHNILVNDLWLTDVDLSILYTLVNIKEIKCYSLFVAKKDYMPRYMQEQIIDAYTKKVACKKTAGEDAFSYAQSKKQLNSIAGNLQKKYTKEEDFNNASESICLAWGAWVTAYGRKNLLKLVLSIKNEDRFYGDTDSCFCLASAENERIVNELNNYTRTRVLKWCKYFGYDFNILKDLGQYEIKDYITKFKANKTKVYCYETKSGNKVIKASGYRKDELNFEDMLPARYAQLRKREDDDEIYSYRIDACDFFLLQQAQDRLVF